MGNTNEPQLQKEIVIGICDCGDIECTRKVKGTSEGKLIVINHFTCGNVKRQIEQSIKIKS